MNDFTAWADSSPSPRSAVGCFPSGAGRAASSPHTPAGLNERSAVGCFPSGAGRAVALVTGANKGIGKDIARQLATAGLTVYVGSRDADRGRRAVEEIGGDARLLVLDVTDATSIAAAASQIGTLDILINNAGIMTDAARVTEADVAGFRRTYETNLFGVLAVTNAFLPALRRSPRPRIVNVSSGTGSLSWSSDPDREFVVAAGSAAAYRSSKTALNAVTLFYAQALAGDGFKVNALAPGLRRTELNARAAASDGDPAEAAAGAVRLALVADDGPTGQFLSWDGTAVPW
jgi:NAD(P)-dependent dehydrogenase (short-subunit alcohol dehydrogenase family)